MVHRVVHGRAKREVRGTEKGGSLTSPSLFPVLPRGLVEDGGKSKGLNKMAEVVGGTLETRKTVHTPRFASTELRELVI